MIEVEKRAKLLNYKCVTLGIDEGKEEFFAKMGYIGKMLIQSEKYGIDELKAFCQQHGNYDITGANV